MAYGQNMKAPNSGIASLMAMRGRQGDNTLVHVNPMELRALNSMAPGGLTQNPATGLPEAFKLKDILPALGAVAGAAILGPALGITGALGAGISTGLGAAAGTAAAGGNREEILASGALSGLTAGLGAKAAGLGTEGAKAAGVGTEGVKGAISDPTTQLGSNVQRQAADIAAGQATKFPATVYPEAMQQSIQMDKLMAARQAPTFMERVGDFGDISKRVGGLSGVATKSLAASTPMLMNQTQPPVKGARPIQSIRTEQRPMQDREEIDRYIRQGGVLPTFFEPNPFVTQPGIYREDGGAVQTQTTDGNTIKGDSYVLDAFDVAAIGNGNTMAGADIIMNALGKSNDDSFSGLVVTDNSGVADDVSFNVRDGGEITKAMISGGEVVLAPDQVERAGGVENIDKFREELTQRVYKGEPSKVDSRFLQKLA